MAQKIKITGEQLAARLKEVCGLAIDPFYTFTKEDEYEAFRQLLHIGPAECERAQKNGRAGEMPVHTTEEIQWTDSYTKRVFWISRHLWYRGLIGRKERYRRPGLQPHWKRVGWDGIAECYRQEHADDQASAKALAVAYGKAAKVLNAEKIFEMFDYLFKHSCSVAIQRFFNIELTQQGQDRLAEFIDRLLNDLEVSLPPKGDELVIYVLAHWERIVAAHDALLKAHQFRSDGCWEGARGALEQYRDNLREHPGLPGLPVQYQTPQYQNMIYTCHPYNVLDDSPAPLFFLGQITLSSVPYHIDSTTGLPYNKPSGEKR